MAEAAAGVAGAEAGAAAAGANAAAAAGAGAAAAPPWHGGKIDADTLGWWQNKGIDAADPVAVATKLTEQYRNAEKLHGVPSNELIRLPKANAAESDLKAFWQKVGVPAEAKDYDFSGIKFADGTDLDQGFSDAMRNALLAARTPKERAPEVVKAMVKFMDGNNAADAAEVTAKVQTEAAALDKNWGTNKPANLVVAKAALDRLGAAAGLTAEQTKAGWDALSKVAGIGASYAMEMLRIAGSRMGEDRYIGGGQGPAGATMSREAAKAEIDSLKKDTDYGRRLLAGGREERRKWDDLHKVAYPPTQVA